jgi:hypothetical protein
MPTSPDRPAETRSEFERDAQNQDLTLVHELWLLVLENRNWWLIPTLVVLALVGLLAALGTSGAAPFIYTLF